MSEIKAQLKWLNRLITDLKENKIAYWQSSTFTRNWDDGVNQGLSLAISKLEKRAKNLEKRLSVAK